MNDILIEELTAHSINSKSFTIRRICGQAAKELAELDKCLKGQTFSTATANKRIGHLQVKITELQAVVDIRNETDVAIGGWLSAALDDPNVCAEMKLDIVSWFADRKHKTPEKQDE